MVYSYPYGSVPSQSYQVQSGVRTNPYGYSAPVAQANPFSALVLAHGMKNAFSGSSSSSDPDVAVVTYDSYMGDKDFSKDTLKISSADMKIHGKPLGLKFKNCGVVIPLPSKVSVCHAVENKMDELAKAKGAKFTDKQREETMKKISENLAIEFFTNQCKYGDKLNASTCSGFVPKVGTNNRYTGEISGLEESINQSRGW